MPRAIHTIVAEAERRYGPEGAAALATRIKAQAARLRTQRECPTALDLAAKYDQGLVRTPALDLLNQRIHDTMRTRDGRLVISIPPQEGKSTTMQWSIARRLVDKPDGRIGFASYASGLARRSGRIVRGRLEAHGEDMGLQLAWDHRDASDWQLNGHLGGMFSVGVGGGFTGRPVDEGLVVDDPIKDQQDADSPAVIQNLMDWWESVALFRLSPGAWVIVIQTRWAEDDLAGRLIGEGWPYVNIPAIADGKAPDSLNRPVGEYLVSALGRTPQDWDLRRRNSGERAWHALCQGMPAPPAGDIFLTEWFDRDRVPVMPPGLPTVVVVDPADNTGDGDESGIIVSGTDAAGHVYLGPDYSAHFTAARWIRVALLAVVRHKAASLVFEQSLSGLDRSVRAGWQQLWKQATALRRVVPGEWSLVVDPDVVELVVGELCHDLDTENTRNEVRAELVELWPLAPAVLDYPDTGPAIRKIVPKGSKEWRAQVTAPIYGQRRVHHVGHLRELEHQQAIWRPGMKSPDRMDACLVGGTPVLTARGEVPIEGVRVGDSVWTRIGWRSVTDSWLTQRAACVWDVELSNGSVLTGTPDHRVWTNNGWSRIDALVHGDILSGWMSPQSPSNTEVSSTGGTRTGNNARTASTTQPPADPETTISIARYGGTPTQTKRSHPGGTCTTTTTTRSTTIPGTSFSSPPQSTPRNTQRKCGLGDGPTSTSSAPSPPLGIPAMPARRGTASTADGHGKAGYPSTSGPAQSAAGGSGPTNPTQSGAPGLVTRGHTEFATPTTSELCALSARRSSGDPDALTPPRHAPVFVVRVSVAAAAADVYDLTVAEAHEFVAAGVIVHNCVHAIMLGTGASAASLSEPDKRRELPTRSRRSRRSSVIPRSTTGRR